VGDKCFTDQGLLKYSPDGTIQYKTIYSDEFQDFPRRSRVSDIGGDVTTFYTESIKIKVSKIKHLMDLKSVIPRDYHAFYVVLSDE